MSTLDQLRAAVSVYDVIVSDFGREATIRYLDVMAQTEREIVSGRLPAGRPFFDEYRRIMYSVVADVAYCKADLIEQVLAAHGTLTREVLVGDDFTPVPQQFLDRVTLLVAQHALAAFDRGHRRLRIVIPCNGLSALAVQVHQTLTSEDRLASLDLPGPAIGQAAARLLDAFVTVHTVTDAVVRRLARGTTPSTVLLLGTAGARSLYEQASASSGLRLVDLNAHEQELVNQAIVAAIGGDTEEVARQRRILEEQVVSPRTQVLGDLTVVEACTDLTLGLGLSSVDIFAHEMVHSLYNPGE